MDEKCSRWSVILTDPSPPTIVGDPMAGKRFDHQLLAGRYEIRAQIGMGGMGSIYRAYDRALDEEIALKVLLPERFGARCMLRRIRREVRVARKVTHPNVCRVFDLGEDGDIWFLTMELVEGRTLRTLLSEGSIEPEQALTILEQITEGIAAAHARGIIHLDLKPENVMICREGRAVVVDFGLARSALVEMSSTNNMAGTLSYMSPEHLRGDALDARSDLFSLGVLAFELLTGRLPFARGSLAAVGGALLKEDPPSLEVAGLPARVVRAVEQVLLRAMAKCPTERFSSAAEFGAALAAARRGDPLGSLPEAGADDCRRRASFSASFYRSRATGRWRAGFAVFTISAAVTALFLWRLSISPKAALSDERASAQHNEPLRAKNTAADLAWRPGIVVADFKNLSGDPSRSALAQGAMDAIRAGLRTMRQVRLLEGVANSDPSLEQLGATWVVEGTVQNVGTHLRLAAQVRAVDGAEAGEPIEVDGDPARVAELLEDIRQRVLDETRLLWQAYDRRRWAERSTSSDEARSALLQYFTLVGLGPRLEHVDAGGPLLDEALARDPDYVPALVERAYLQSISSAGRGKPDGFTAALEDLDRALGQAPADPRALVMRCRLLQVALNPNDRPTDADIARSVEACHTAMQADPSSAYVPFVLARLHDLRCEDGLAIAALERALELDRSLSGRVLTHMVTLALLNNRLPLADRMSKRLVEFQMEEARLGIRSLSRRAGVAPTRMGHVLRAASLVQMKRLDEARQELECELEAAVGRMGNPWSEPAAIRGLLRIARLQRRAAPPALERRLSALEQARFAETANDPQAAHAVAVTYAWTDSNAAIEWIEKMPPPTSFRQALARALSYHAARDDVTARRLIAVYKPTEQWEQSCAVWAKSKLSVDKLTE